MKILAAILLAALASCATPPRAILPPPSVIAELDTAPVSKAATQTREAVRDIAAAGQETREASRKLSDTSILLRASIDRAEKLAAANAEIQEAFAEIQRFAMQLNADVERLKSANQLSAEKERIAIITIDDLTSSVATLEADKAAQSAQIRIAHANEETLRNQVNTLAAASDDLAIAKDKLSWWRNAALWTWGVLVALTILGALLRRAGRFPF